MKFLEKTKLRTGRLRSSKLGLGLVSLGFAVAAASSAPLTTLEYRISGIQLQVSPAALAVPKGIAGSVLVQVITGNSTNAPSSAALTEGAYVEATLRGPSFAARRIVSLPNAPLLLPPLNLVGDYQLDNIRLVDAVTGETRLEGSPSSVPVRVFDEILVSRVTSRPLTLNEIQEKGIVIDEKNFRAVEFEVGFVLDGKNISVRFPVIAPTFSQSTEVIPKAELEEKLAEAAALNQQIASTVELPPELEQSQLNIQITGINFQFVEPSEQDLQLRIPPIPALVVIPGNIGFLNQFFSVQIFTENGAPIGSGLNVLNLKAQMVLPPGPDRITSTNYNAPGDDPLRFARVGPDKIIQPIQPVVRPGPDGKVGTSDDILRLLPGEGGQGEFLVEGLQEGLHVMDISLTADLEGLAAGLVKINGKAAGSVLVRNPKFSLAFTHPKTIRSGEPYEASVTILNTGITPANLVNVTLPGAAISGGALESPQTVELGTLLPGQSATATFRIRAQRTGAISFSNLTTGDDSVQGRFRLSMGIDERGVALSPDTIGMPEFVNALPANVLSAANRVLGQALSVATAAQLPPGVIKVPKSLITKRVLELAEAGQRARYGDPMRRVLADLLLDWQGGRNFNEGFDQIVRETDAGREWREAMAQEMDRADGLDAVVRLANRLPDIAGRGETWSIFALDTESGEIRFGDGVQGSIPPTGTNITARYDAPTNNSSGLLFVTRNESQVFEWRLTNDLSSARLALALVNTNGTARRLDWTLNNLSAGACVRMDSGIPVPTLLVDTNCDGSTDASLAAVETLVNELPPGLIGVLQDPTVNAGRPFKPCATVPYDPRNYGTVLAVLFSKPMTQNGVNLPTAYSLENGNRANSVQIQPGGRVALLNMARPVGAIRQRTLTVTGVADPRGNAIVGNSKSVTNGLVQGTAIRGRVVRADGTAAPGVPVTLTYYDLDGSGFDCRQFIVRPSQVFTDANGYFDFDFVLSGIGYSISATDTIGLPPEAIALLLESAAGDEFARSKLLQQLQSQENQETILSAFGAASLSQAIAAAEGLDRALLRDLVPRGSPREGTETVVALRFRGRGSVSGQVLLSDGVNPANGAAVNLFPDPDSRELGRGIFADSNGRFTFVGVPLGVFTIQAAAVNGQTRTVAGVLDQVSQSNYVSVVLSATPVMLAQLRGRVFEPDNVTPHANARVFVGRFNEQGQFVDVVAAVTADADGFWSATNFPGGTYDVAAVSFDGKRKGDRRNVQATLSTDTLLNISLNGRTTVAGRVEFFNGSPATNALVAGGDTIVRTDNNGLFTLTGVPTGNRNISAGLERNLAAGIRFPRFGSAQLNVVAGVDNFVVIRLRPAGSISGRVLNALAQPVPNARVAIPQENGFLWTDADANGNYIFEGLALGDYTLSAPAPNVAKTDTSGFADILFGGTQDEIRAAIGEAFRIFTGVSDPFLLGEPFNPQTWGFAKTRLTFDGQPATADIHFLRQGTVGGIVLNGQNVPIGAKVRLTGIGPLANGDVGFVIRGDMNSDPALGTFTFTNALLVGAFGLQAASPFFPTVITTSGQTTSTEPNSTNNVLQFPAAREINGRLIGTVFYPNGTPVGSNVNVVIGNTNFIVRTETNGTYDAHSLLAGGYTIEANDPATGLRGQSVVNVLVGITNVCNVQLIGKGALTIVVRQANGSPATNASVEIQQGTFPQDRFTGTTDTNGVLRFQNIFAGSYAVCASIISGPTTIFGRAGATVVTGATNAVTVTLGPTATLRGTFVKRDLITPIGFAQVAVGNLGFATSDAAGKFEVAGIPLGTYRLVSQDPVSGIGAVANVTLSFDGEVRDVLLVEQSRGEVRGGVVNSYGNGFVPGANVTLQTQDGLTPPRTVTTGPDGFFSFPGTPAGAFSLTAEDPVSRLRGQTSGTLLEGIALVQIDVPLQPLTRQTVTIFEPNGVTPATNATVKLFGPKNLTSDTDATGRVAFVDLPLGSYSLQAFSRRSGATRSAIKTNLVLNLVGDAPALSVRLAGVGSVGGRVFLSDGSTPANGAEVELRIGAELFFNQMETVFADSAGNYSFTNIAVGAYTVTARAVALGVTRTGAITNDAQTDIVNLTLGASGTVLGRLVRADGTTIMPDVDVALTFTSQSGLPGVAVQRTDANGAFSFANIPQGSFMLDAAAPSVGGLAHLISAITSNGQTNNLGNVRLDEDDPRVVAVDPPHTAVGLPITTVVTLTFNEALATNRLETNAIFVRLVAATTNVPAQLQLLPDPTNSLLRIIRITPSAPLLSERTYEVVVIDGDRLDALGNIVARGPVDLVSRPLAVPFVSRFTTADNDPPQLVSIFPSNNAVQIDPRAVMRLSFNEAVRSTGFVFTVTGPGGPVAGAASVGLNGLAMNFTPAAELAPNTIYSLRVSNVFDIAGNRAAGEPFVASFTTLDTLGPNIAALRLVTNQSPVANSTVQVEAVLATSEPDASVRFTQDLIPVGAKTNSPFRIGVTLPASGSTTIRAIATDQYNNDGPFADLVINVVSNQAPVANLIRLNPASGPLRNGQTFSLQVSATDDAGVTNLALVGVGPLSFSTNFPDGSARALTFTVPAAAAPGAIFRYVAQATDALGIKSPEVELQIQVIDATAPVVSIVNPQPNAVLNLSQNLALAVASSDNNTNYQLRVVLSGGVASTQTLAVATGANVTVTNIFNFSLGSAPTNGSSVTATVTATDNATNVSSVSRTFLLPDIRPPQLVSVSPSDGTAKQSLWAGTVAFDFDEGLNPATATTNNVTVTNNGGATTPFAVSLANNNQQLRLTLNRPLLPGISYTNILLPGLTDGSSNAWRNIGSASVPTNGASFAFTTANILGVQPTNGAAFIVGQNVPVNVSYETGIGAAFFRFSVNSTVVTQAVAGVSNTTVAVRMPTNGTQATLSIVAANEATFSEPFALAPITLNLQSLSGDTDGDGMPNAFEVTYDLDPFRNDASENPDGDGLMNLQEFQAGTNPRNPDTDGDGLPDGIDPNPLVPDRPPVAQMADLRAVPQLNGVNDAAQRDSVTSALNIGLSNWTVSAWIRTGATNNTNSMTIAARYECGQGGCSSPDGNASSYWELGLDSTGRLFFGVRGDTGDNNFHQASGTTDLRDGNFHHVSGVLDRQANEIRILVDGLPAGTASATGVGEVRDPVSPFTIGKRFIVSFPSPQFFFQGNIYDVRAWNVPRTPAQLISESAGPSRGDEAGLAGYWALNEGFGSTANDLTTNGNHLSLQGNPLWQPLTLQTNTADRIVELQGFGASNALLTATITTLPGNGARVFQTLDGATRDAQITTVPANVINTNRQVILAPALAVSTNYFFRYQLNNGVANSSETTVALAVQAAAGTDTDGDGMPDIYEVANGLNPEVNDASLDADSDGLANLQEFVLGTNPRTGDTDNDGLGDGAEVALGCADPLKADTDGDGLSDGTDPDPCNVATGLAFLVTNRVDLFEGATSNLTVQVASTASQVVLIDYSPTNPAPAFVTVKSRTFNNGPTNGVAVMELEFNPLHDAAGEHVLTLRAAAADGQSATVNIRLVVADNPAITFTRWKDPVDGNWSDASKWSDGLPDPTKVGVIDAAGSYVVSLNTSVTAAGIVMNESNAVLRTASSPTLNAPAELRRGRFEILTSSTVTLNRPLANRGTLRWISRNNNFNLQGSGRVENLGLWEIFSDPGCPTCGSESDVRVPVNVPAGGKLLLSTNALVNFTQPSGLTMAGELEIQSGARLRLDSSSPARDVTLLAGGQWTGAGPLALEGSSRLVIMEDHLLDQPLQMGSSTAVTGVGRLLITANESLTGTFGVDVEIRTNATVNFSTATFRSNITVNAGALMTVNSSATITLDNVLTNRGTLRWISRNNNFDVRGSGRLENLGLWEVFSDPGCPTCGSESDVRVPVNVPAGGKLLLSTNALVNFTQPSSLTVAGELEIQSGARLRVDGSSPARDVNLLTGAQWTGAGTLSLEGGCRLVIAEDTVMPGRLQVGTSAAIAGTGTFTLTGSQSLNGIYNVPLVVSTNAVVNFGSATFNQPATVQSGGTWTINSSATITLNSALTNRGAMKWISRNNTFNLNGSGTVENLGLWEIFSDACPSCGSESDVRVPVNVPAGGKLLLSTNALVNFTQPSSLTVAGELEIQSGARLRLDGSNPARDVALAAGSILSGTGLIQLEGGCRLVVPGDLDTTVNILLNGSSTRLIVPGIYTVRAANQGMVGTVQSAAVIITSNATVTASSSAFTGLVSIEDGGRLRLVGGTVSFGTNVTVNAGARWDLDASTTVVLNGALTNRGAMKWISRNNTFNLNGSGTVENLGLWEVFSDACPTCGSESDVRVPVNVPAGGKLLLSTNALVNFTQPSSLNVAGELEIQSGARLRLDGSNPARDVALAAGSIVGGAGTLRFEGANRLALTGNVTVGIGSVEFVHSSSITGTNLLTIAAGSTVSFDHNSTIPGSVTVNGTFTLTSSSVTLVITGTLTLNSGGVLNNPGTLQVGQFVNNGGTVNGNAPIVVGPRPAQLRIRAINVINTSSRPTDLSVASRVIALTFVGPSGGNYSVEASSDMRTWAPVTATITEVRPGEYQVAIEGVQKSVRFFRVRDARPQPYPSSTYRAKP